MPRSADSPGALGAGWAEGRRWPFGTSSRPGLVLEGSHVRFQPRLRRRLVRAPKGLDIRLQPKDFLSQSVDRNLLTGLAVLEPSQPPRKILETEFVADGREAVNVCIRDFNYFPFNCRPEQPENLC
jgi:hypothetical protein